ncbi:hypothetical protein ACLMNJ_25445 [Streptomyces seoulensis]
MSDTLLSFIPADPRWQPDRDAADRAVCALRALAPDDDGIKATWHDEIMFVDCGSRFDEVACPRCDAVLDKHWLGDRLSAVLMKETLTVVVPCCGGEPSLNDLVYREPCGLARFDITVWNPGRSLLSEGELRIVGVSLGHPVRQIMAHY